MKKVLVSLFILFFIFTPVISFVDKMPCNNACYAETQDELESSLQQQLNDLDFSEAEDVIESLNENQKAVFGNSFIDKVKMIINGDFSGGFSTFWEMLLSLLFDNILALLPLLATIIAISILGGMAGNLTSPSKNQSLSNVVHFIIYGIIVVMLSGIIVKMVSLTTTTIYSIKSQVEIIFPILLTTLTALGGTASVGAYQPAIAMFSGVIVEILTNLILPLFLVSLVLNLVSNLSNSIKLDKLISFVNSLSKWALGIIFTIFTAFIAIQGISAGAVDGLSIKTAKFTIKNSLPLVGGYLSDGLFLVLASTNLIKNAVGGAGLFLLLISVISPIIELVLFMLCLKLIAGIIEPLGDAKIAGFVSTLSKSMTMLIVMIACVSFMYIILTGLVMCSANII